VSILNSHIEANLTLIRMAIKKCVAMWQEVMYDSQAPNSKQEGLPVRARHPPLPALLLVGRKSYMTPSRLECSKTPPQTGGSSCFLIEKSLGRTFFK
jgi:hypothetical protein